MKAFELKRVDRGDGHHDVTVVVGPTDTVVLRVDSRHLDGPGFQEMMDLQLARHIRLVNVREGRPES